MKSSKKSLRLKRARKTRARINEQGVPRITVTRSNKNIRAQIIIVENKAHKVLATASSLDKDIATVTDNKINVAKLVGKSLAEKATKAGVSKVAFDRAGFKYHGRIKALADAAREGGIEF